MMASEGKSRRAEKTIPRVSVIVPACNRERFVGLTVESVLAQRFQEWELIVYDDGSTDRTLEVARSYADRDPRIKVGHGPNGGVASARNHGFALADLRAEFVIFLDSDDLWEPDALDILVAELDAHPEYVAAHCLARCIDDQGRLVPGDDLEERSRQRKAFRDGGLVPLDPDEPTTFGALVYHNWVVTPGTQLIRREVFALVGGFDPSTDPADDADLAIRMSRLGDIGFVDRPLVQWRRHPETLSNTSPRWLTATVHVRAKTLTAPTNTAAQREAARLAYLHTVISTFRESRRAMAKRAFAEGVRTGLKAAYLYQAYLRATLKMRLGLVVGTPSARRTHLARCRRSWPRS